MRYFLVMIVLYVGFYGSSVIGSDDSSEKESVTDKKPIKSHEHKDDDDNKDNKLDEKTEAKKPIVIPRIPDIKRIPQQPKNDYIISLKPSLTQENREKYLKQYGIMIVSDASDKIIQVTLDPDVGIEAIRVKIKESIYINYIEPNYTYSIF